jgi:hypothetical protein
MEAVQNQSRRLFAGHGNLDCAQGRCPTCYGEVIPHAHEPHWTCSACCAAGRVLPGHCVCEGCDCARHAKEGSENG